jgi:hypothetical protein
MKYHMIEADKHSTITEKKAIEIIGKENFEIAMKDGSLSWIQDDVEIFFSADLYEQAAEKLAVEIIRRNTTYADAYAEMADAGIEDPDVYWNRHIEQCGEDTE